MANDLLASDDFPGNAPSHARLEEHKEQFCLKWNIITCAPRSVWFGAAAVAMLSSAIPPIHPILTGDAQASGSTLDSFPKIPHKIVQSIKARQRKAVRGKILWAESEIKLPKSLLLQQGNSREFAFLGKRSVTIYIRNILTSLDLFNSKQHWFKKKPLKNFPRATVIHYKLLLHFNSKCQWTL